MGGVLGCMAGQCFGCVGCGLFNAMGSVLGAGSNLVTPRIRYAVFFLFNCIIAWLLLTDWANETLAKISYGYLKISCSEGYCYGILAVHRLMFSFSCFHAILGFALAVVGSSGSRMWRSNNVLTKIQDGYWPLKIIGWLVIVVVSFCIPNQFFAGWGNSIAIGGAGVFILIQLVLLIDFAFSWSEHCLRKWEIDESEAWKCVLVGGTLGMYLVSAIMIGLMYGFFAQPGCTGNRVVITVTTILCVLVSLLAVDPLVQSRNPRSGLSQAAVVTLYAVYLLVSAIVYQPDSGFTASGSDGVMDDICNPLAKHRATRATTILLGAIFTFIAVSYSTSRAAIKGSYFMGPNTMNNEDVIEAESAMPLISGNGESMDSKIDALKAAIESGALPASALNQSADAADHESSVDAGSFIETTDGGDPPYNYAFFHCIFALAAMYVAMLLTDWNTLSFTEKLTVIGRSKAALWVKVSSSWLSLLLFAWTLVAPLVLPDREW